MPQGKGTYGKKVGRPPKKDKYYGGGKVDPFSTKNPEGVPLEKLKEMQDVQEKAEMSIPTINAKDRSKTISDIEEYE